MDLVGPHTEDIQFLLHELQVHQAELAIQNEELRRAIGENAEDLRAKYPHTRINLELSDDPTRLPDPIALALYRIYQQAMNNIHRHAKASEVWVRLKLDPRQILFEIQDDGQGISGKIDWDAYARQGHFGLMGMKERAEAIGGKFQFISQPGEGTLVDLFVPLYE